MDKKAKAFFIVALIISTIALLSISVAFAKPTARGLAECKDGIDNDGDGYNDWPDDPGCTNKNDQSELNPNIACDDGSDNDGDGVIDMNDPGCSSPSDTSEYGNVECDDGGDNDGDGVIDMNDPGCSSLTDNDESNCGDNVCEGEEDCSNCATDCLDVGEICCDGTSYTGDCCSDNDCTTPDTCVNNACQIADSCYDSDGGWFLGILGTVSGYDNEQPYNYTDFCINSTTIQEYMCSGTSVYISESQCSWSNYTVCTNGACI